MVLPMVLPMGFVSMCLTPFEYSMQSVCLKQFLTESGC